MKLILDTEAKTLTVTGDEETQELALYSKAEVGRQ